MGEDPENINFNEILNCEYIGLLRAPHVTNNYVKRKDDHWADLINENSSLEKAVSYYLPVDETQMSKYEGSLPPLLPFS